MTPSIWSSATSVGPAMPMIQDRPATILAGSGGGRKNPSLMRLSGSAS